MVVFIPSVGAVAAQNDFPNAVTECPDSCVGEQCARFLNDECQESLHGLIRSGINVTNCCPVKRCTDKIKRYALKLVQGYTITANVY